MLVKLNRNYAGVSGKISDHPGYNSFLTPNTVPVFHDIRRKCTASSPLQYSIGVPSLPSSGWAEGGIRRVKVNYTFGNLEGQDETSEFQ